MLIRALSLLSCSFAKSSTCCIPLRGAEVVLLGCELHWRNQELQTAPLPAAQAAIQESQRQANSHWLFLTFAVSLSFSN